MLSTPDITRFIKTTIHVAKGTRVLPKYIKKPLIKRSPPSGKSK